MARRVDADRGDAEIRDDGRLHVRDAIARRRDDSHTVQRGHGGPGRGDIGGFDTAPCELELTAGMLLAGPLLPGSVETCVVWVCTASVLDAKLTASLLYRRMPVCGCRWPVTLKLHSSGQARPGRAGLADRMW